jgi:hypothetical protein
MNPKKTPGSGPVKSSKSGPGATASGVGLSVSEFKTAMSSAVTAILEFTAATNKRTANKELELTGDSGWGRPCSDNSNNPAQARQDAEKKSKNN